jgi:hypothetical protein
MVKNNSSAPDTLASASQRFGCGAPGLGCSGAASGSGVGKTGRVFKAARLAIESFPPPARWQMGLISFNRLPAAGSRAKPSSSLRAIEASAL